MTVDKKYERGLMAGRFQPFHNGHLALARRALGECGELVIVIGSAQFNFLEKDPFTAGERMLMIHEGLREAGADLSRCYIVPVRNDENNARWLANLRSQVPPFDAVYSGNEFVAYLASAQDPSLAVVRPDFLREKEYNGTNIRRLISSGSSRDWEQLVPPAVARLIGQVGGVERMRMLARSESEPHRW